MKRQAEARVEALEPRLEPGVFSASKPIVFGPGSLPGSQAPGLPVGRSGAETCCCGRKDGYYDVANCRRFQIQQLG